MKSIGLIAVAVLVIFCIIVAFISHHQIKEYVSSANSTAKMHYNYFSKVIELLLFTNVPADGEYVVMGECHDFASYTAYTGDLFEQDTFLYGNKNLIANSYWAIRIDDGQIVEAWSSNYPLNKTQLHAYTEDEQCKEIHMFEKFKESEIVGYYRIQE